MKKSLFSFLLLLSILMVTNAQSSGTWSAWGTGVMGEFDDGRINTIAVSGSQMYVGGEFVSINGVAAKNIAKWDGSTWSALGTGIEGEVNAIAVIGANVFVGGDFSDVGNSTVNNVALWNGFSWSALGNGVNNGVNGRVNAIAIDGSDVYVGGDFLTAGNLTMNGIAKWDGSGWSPLGLGVSDYVNVIYRKGSDLYVGGEFFEAGNVSANNIAKWNGNSWSTLGVGTNKEVTEIISIENDFYIGGWFTQAGGSPANGIAKWNGSSWSALGNGVYTSGQHNTYATSIAVLGSSLYVGGRFEEAGSTIVNCVAKWNGSTWSALENGVSTDGTTPVIEDVAILDGDVVVGGIFENAGNIQANHLANWEPAITLPLTLISFKVQNTERTNTLAWMTTNEQAMKWFTVERSVDGESNWETLDNVLSKGKIGSTQRYLYIDQKPLALSYYRLKMVEIDNQISYSEIRQVQSTVTEKLTGLHSYPNPANSEVMINYNFPIDVQHKTLQVVDNLGRQIRSYSIADGVEGRISLFLNDLQEGIYFLNLVADAEIIATQSLVIAR